MASTRLLVECLQLTLFKAFAEQTKPGSIDPDCFEQSVRFVNEKKEASLSHWLTKLLGNDSLQPEHPKTHVDGLLVEISNGVVR